MDKTNQISLRVKNILNEKFSSKNYKNLISLSRNVESFLLKIAIKEFIQIIQQSANAKELHFKVDLEGFHYTLAEKNKFLFDNVSYQLMATVNGSILNFELLAIQKKYSNIIDPPIEINFSSCGRYSGIEIECEEKFVSEVNKASESIRIIFIAGYNWLEETILNLLNAERKNVAGALYNTLREILPKKAVDYTWLFVISTDLDLGFYISDPNNIKQGLNRLKNREINESPIDLITKKVTSVLPPDNTESLKAIKKGAAKEFVLETADYSDTGLQIAETGVFETEVIIVDPIIREGKYLLTAGYPARFKVPVLNILKEKKNRFLNVLNGEKIKMETFLKNLKENYILPNFSTETLYSEVQIMRELKSIESQITYV